MAVFENIVDKPMIDESKPYISEIKETCIIDNHIEYVIEVSRYPDIDQNWTVNHRFSDFVNLHSALKTPTLNLPPLPPKRVFGNTDKNFINERKVALQAYLKELSNIYYVTISPAYRKFMDPLNYVDNFSVEAKRCVLTCLRSGGNYDITQDLPHVGTRVKKCYFIGVGQKDCKIQQTLSWAEYGPDKVKHLRDIHVILTSFVQCQHPYIVSAVKCIATETGACVIRPWFVQGSLRDYIYGVKPQYDSLLKYTNDRRREIPIKTCAVYGRQILEALQFLHEKGIAHGCLHSGNVVIDDNVCRLMDLENQVFGLPHPLRRFVLKVKKVDSPQALDVYAFGHLLYEMVFLKFLKMETCNLYPFAVSPLCRSVLESILSSEACKNGLPSVANLLTHPFFNDVPLISYGKPYLKLSVSAKNALISAQEASFARLAEDQKTLKTLRQKTRAEAVLRSGHEDYNE